MVVRGGEQAKTQRSDAVMVEGLEGDKLGLRVEEERVEGGERDRWWA